MPLKMLPVAVWRPLVISCDPSVQMLSYNLIRLSEMSRGLLITLQTLLSFELISFRQRRLFSTWKLRYGAQRPRSCKPSTFSFIDIIRVELYDRLEGLLLSLSRGDLGCRIAILIGKYHQPMISAPGLPSGFIRTFFGRERNKVANLTFSIGSAPT